MSYGTAELRLLAEIRDLIANGGDVSTNATFESNTAVVLSQIKRAVQLNGIGGGGSITEPIHVNLLGGRTLGKYVNGSTINAAGQTLTLAQLITDLANELPNAVAPDGTIYSNLSTANIEIGTALNIVLSNVFTQNNGGALISVQYKKNGSNVSDTDTIIASAVAVVYNALFSYAAGVTDPSYNGSIAAGSVGSGNSISYAGAYKNFFGAAATVPANSAAVRALASNTFADQFILNTGTAYLNFIASIPSGKAIVSVIDLDALNLDITAEYIQQAINVNDAGGTPYANKMYVKTNGVAYGTNHRHQITIA